MFTLAGDSPDQAAERSRRRHRRSKPRWPRPPPAARRPARSREALPHLHRRRLPEARARLRLAVYFKDVNVGHFDTLNVGHARLLQGAERADRLRARRLLEDLSPLAHPARPAPQTFPRPSSTRISTSSRRRSPARRNRRRAGSSAPRMTDRALGEAVGQDWVQAELPARGQGQHG